MDYTQNISSAIGLTTLAGLSTALGGLMVVFLGRPSSRMLGHMLSFSAGVMLFISFIDLMPEAVASVGFGVANVAFFVGMFLFWLVVQFIPEPDPLKETSVLPSGRRRLRSSDKKGRTGQLSHVSLMMILGVSLHNFPEGLVVYLTALQGTGMALPLVLAIAFHNIPEGCIIAAPIYHATGSRWQAFKWSLISGMCEPAGAILIGVLFTKYLTEAIIKTSLAGVAGVMVYMSIELIAQSVKHLSSHEAMYSNVVGMMGMSFSVWYLQEYLGFKMN